MAINEAHVNGRDNGQRVEQALKRVGHAIMFAFGTIFIFIDNIFRFGMGIIDQFLVVFRLISVRLFVMVFIIQISHMRILMSQSNNEVIMRSGGRRIKRPDEPLKQNVTGKIITPIVNGCVAEMLHKNERADQKSGINGRPAGVGI